MKGKVFIAVMLMALMVPFAAFAASTSFTYPGTINLGSSGKLAAGPVVPYVKEPIVWEAGLAGHSHYTINPAKTALLIIDPQKVYSKAFSLDVTTLPNTSPLNCDEFDTSIVNINAIADACRAKGIPVFIIAHVYKANGSNCGRLCDFDPLGWLGYPAAWNLWNEAVYDYAKLDERMKIVEGDYYAEKSVFSSFTKEVVAKLKEKGVDTVIVTGFMTQYCSVTATRHGHDLGYKMINVKDANDGPVLEEVLSGGVNENDIVPFYMSIPVADVMDTDTLVNLIKTAN